MIMWRFIIFALQEKIILGDFNVHTLWGSVWVDGRCVLVKLINE